MKKWIFHTILFLSIESSGTSATIEPDTTLPGRNLSERKWLAAGITAVSYGGSFYFLNKAWYKDHARSSFHTYNDAKEWQQVDKVGHAWTAYSLSRATGMMWQWSGVDHRTSVLLGSGTSLAYLFSIEYLDGRSADWGWSWADIGADIFGASLYTAQEFAWKDQRIQFKFSSHLKNYNQTLLQQRADELFGESLPERLLKDYNYQTYWLSFNMASFLPETKIPGWLNISIGYGAHGMFGGYENIAYDKNGNIIFDRRDIRRYRQWYLSPDIDFTRIKTGSGFLRTAFSILNILKFPAPALEFSRNKFRLKAIAF